MKRPLGEKMARKKRDDDGREGQSVEEAEHRAAAGIGVRFVGQKAHPR
ncbi:MAG: hypothetical protein M5R36_07220 [Deltaproteobacteria bacterium]|nr:hypothetical protein [Deltaproteobacteria bacterium]